MHYNIFHVNEPYYLFNTISRRLLPKTKREFTLIEMGNLFNLNPHDILNEYLELAYYQQAVTYTFNDSYLEYDTMGWSGFGFTLKYFFDDSEKNRIAAGEKISDAIAYRIEQYVISIS